MPALECGRTLVVLSECGRVAQGEVFDDRTELHELVAMIGFDKIGVAGRVERTPPVFRSYPITGGQHLLIMTMAMVMK